MRVLLFTDSDSFAGTERHMLDLAGALRVLGIDTAIGCPGSSPLAEKARTQGVAVVPIAKGGLVDLGAIRRLCILLKKERFAIIHAHNGRTALSATLATLLARQGKVILTQHFITPDHTSRRGWQASIYRAAHRFVNSRIAQTIAISQAVRQGIVDRREAMPAKIALVPNGIPEPAYHPKELSLVRKDIGIPSDAFLFSCLARLEPEKDIPTLVAAMAIVRRAHPNAYCVVAGEGSERLAIAAQIEGLGLTGHVRLLGYREDAADLIGASDAVVLPSPGEPFGLVVLEAMASAKPVVAIRAGGPAEIVVDGETGLLAPAGDTGALAAALLRLADDPAAARAMGARGQQRFNAVYTARQMGEATKAVYEQAFRPKSAPAPSKNCSNEAATFHSQT